MPVSTGASQETMPWPILKTRSFSTPPQGRVVIAMRPDLAPGHVARIKELVNEGFYDGIVFHRVIDGFMAQTGCPQGTGTGGFGPEAQGRIQQRAACARHGVDGARGQSGFRRQPVLHLLR